MTVKYDIYVITDEAYEHIVYQPYAHTCIAMLQKALERLADIQGKMKQ